MSENPKKTFLQSLGKYVLSADQLPPVEPTPPPAEPPPAPPADPAASPVPPAPAAPTEAPPAQPVPEPPKPPVADPPKPPPEPAKPPRKPKSEPLPAIEKEDLLPEETPPEAPKPIAELLGYSPSRAELRYLEDLREAERMDPRYSGYFDREVDRLKRVHAFTEEWKVEHPEEDLTPDVPKYRQFLKANPPAVDAEERQDIRVMVHATNVAQKAKAEVRAELSDKLREVDAIKAEPVISKQERAVEEAVLAALPDGDPLYVAAKAGGLSAVADVPIDGQVVATAVQRGKTLVREFISLRRGLVDLDPANEYHTHLANTISVAAGIFAEQGGPERMRDGKRFVAPEQYGRLTPAARKKHWTFSEDDIVQIIQHQAAAGAQEVLKQTRDNLAAREAKLKPPAPAKPTGEPKPPAPEPPKPPPPSSPPLTPSTIGSPSPTSAKETNPRLKKMLGIGS